MSGGQEVAGEADRQGVVVLGAGDRALLVDLEDPRARQREQDGGVGGDDDLASLRGQVRQQCHAAAHRQRRLRFVEDVEPARAEPVDGQVQERLAVGALVR